MQDLRLVTVTDDGRHLLLADTEGTQYQLPLDEALIAAVRGDRSRLGQLQIELESALRPAEIQARIRAGATAEEVAQVAGVPVERVRRYEGPVLDEREHIARAARSTAVRRQGEGGPVPTLEDLAAQRLEKRGVGREALRWDSWRRDDGRWTVRLSFKLPGSLDDEQAAWVFDPASRAITPEGRDARELTDAEPPVDRAARKLASVRTPLGPDDVYDQEAAAAAAGAYRGDLSRPVIAPVAAEEAIAELEAPSPPVAAPDAPDAGTRTPADDDAVEPSSSGTASAADAVSESSVPADPDGEAPADAESSPGQPAGAGRHAARSGSRSKRPSVPSWDEIVFGARKRD